MRVAKSTYKFDQPICELPQSIMLNMTKCTIPFLIWWNLRIDKNQTYVGMYECAVKFGEILLMIAAEVNIK